MSNDATEHDESHDESEAKLTVDPRYGWVAPIYGREDESPEGIEWCSFCGAYTSCDYYDNLQPSCDCTNYKGGYQVCSELNWDKMEDFLEQFPDEQAYIEQRIHVLEWALEMELAEAYLGDEEKFVSSIRVKDYVFWLKEARKELGNFPGYAEWANWGHGCENVGGEGCLWRDVWMKHHPEDGS